MAAPAQVGSTNIFYASEGVPQCRSLSCCQQFLSEVYESFTRAQKIQTVHEMVLVELSGWKSTDLITWNLDASEVIYGDFEEVIDRISAIAQRSTFGGMMVEAPNGRIISVAGLKEQESVDWYLLDPEGRGDQPKASISKILEVSDLKNTIYEALLSERGERFASRLICHLS